VVTGAVSQSRRPAENDGVAVLRQAAGAMKA
jgi:hypothetical protein